MSTCEHPGCVTHPDDTWEQLQQWATHQRNHAEETGDASRTAAYNSVLVAINDLTQTP